MPNLPQRRSCGGLAKGHPEATKVAWCSWSIPLAHPRRCGEVLAPATESIRDAPRLGEGTQPRVLGTLCRPGVARPPPRASPVARSYLEP